MSRDPVETIDTASLHCVMAAIRAGFPYVGDPEELEQLLERYYDLGPPYILTTHAMQDIAAAITRLRCDLLELLDCEDSE